MEGIDDNLENDKIILVKVDNVHWTSMIFSIAIVKSAHFSSSVQCSDSGVDDHFGIGYLPRLVYFEGNLLH